MLSELKELEELQLSDSEPDELLKLSDAEEELLELDSNCRISFKRP